MGIHTMGSQGGGEQSQFQSIGRQNSLYSLTLDEVQNQLGNIGKPLSSMNLDELLKNVWSAEGLEMDSPPVAQMGSTPGLQRQGSVTIDSALSKKTVDEVWRDIQQGQRGNNQERKAKERQPTLGEMTLEDFLVKAGIVAEGLEKKNDGQGETRGLDLSQGMRTLSPIGGIDLMSESPAYPQQGQWLQYQYQQQAQSQQKNMMNAYMPGCPAPQHLSMSPNPLLDVSYLENQMPVSSPLTSTLSDTQTPGRKRVAPGDLPERTVERRQKRMIKNRESAARSRARKQAYTNELENKISRLEEENERLKKQKELDRILYCTPPPEPKYQLRRTSSASF